MIPTEEQCKKLWDKYNLPKEKRVHVVCVATVSKLLAEGRRVDRELLLAGALLHDIDKAAVKLPGEKHPDAAVRILKEEGMDEVANVVKTHPLHAILDPKIAPKTWEEKILYLADKMCKYDIVGVDERFRLWNAEHLPKSAQAILDRSYPEVKKLEEEIQAACIAPEEVYTKNRKGGI